MIRDESGRLHQTLEIIMDRKVVGKYTSCILSIKKTADGRER